MTWWEWLIYGAPWWLQAAGGALLVGAVLIPLSRVIGLTRTLEAAAVAAAVLGALAYGRRERQQGWADREAKGKRDADHAIDAARKARADSDARSAGGGLRDDDGWRRD